MALTSEQRERLLGQIAMGASLQTACAALGIPYLDLLFAWDSDRAFRMALHSVQDLRDILDLACSETNLERLREDFEGHREDSAD